jgi:hypothetical protein
MRRLKVLTQTETLVDDPKAALKKRLGSIAVIVAVTRQSQQALQFLFGDG